MNYQHLNIEQHGRVLTVSLNNPPLNFLTAAMMAELEHLCIELEKNDDIGAVILTSALPDVFLTHFDVSEIRDMAANLSVTLPATVTNTVSRVEAALAHLPGSRKLAESTALQGVAQTNQFHATTARIRSMNKVFIAAINGRAMGGGLELALSCDLRLIAEGSVEGGQMVGLPEITIGLIPGGGGTQLLTRLLGPARALELCLEARLLSPQEAFELGLVTRVVSPELLMSEATALAERLARRSTAAVGALKRCVHQGGSTDLSTGMQIEKAEFMAVATQRSTRDAMTAYADAVEALVNSGKDLGIEDFQGWLDGNMVNFNK